MAVPVLAIPVLLFLVAFAWYLSMRGIYAAGMEAMKRSEVRQSMVDFLPKLANAEVKGCTKRGEDEVYQSETRLGMKGQTYKVACKMCGATFEVEIIRDRTRVPIMPQCCVLCGSLKVTLKKPNDGT